MKNIIKKYIADFLVIVGVLIFESSVYKICRPGNPFNIGSSKICHPNWIIIISTLLILIGIDMFLRKYFIKK